MTDPNQSLPIAGWYPDPEDNKGDRWWNGSSWSDHRRARDAMPGWAPVATAAAAGATATWAAAPGAAATPAVAPVVGAPSVARPNPYAGQPMFQPNVAAGPVQPYPGGTQPYAPAVGQYAPTYQPYYAAPPRSSVRNMPALVGFIVSLAGLFLFLSVVSGLIGGILGIVGLQKSKQLRATEPGAASGSGFAWAAILIGFISFIGAILIFILIGIWSNSATYY
ncbi:hypothetical protein BH11ACT3_BH11ACT3_16160 [soil metagenome]